MSNETKRTALSTFASTARRGGRRSPLLGLALGAALALFAGCAMQRDEAPAGSAGAGGSASAGGGLEEVVVTGSRVERDRYLGPRPPYERSERAGAPSQAQRSASAPAASVQGVPTSPVSPSASNAIAQASGALGAFQGPMPPQPSQVIPPRSRPMQLLSRVEPGEELWVIQTSVREQATEDDEPGSGTMLALVAEQPANEPTEVPLPLKHTDVRALVTGYIGTVDVTQQFENPYDEKIEAVYLFPLPEKAAVNEFVMTIGDRKIRGILREKEEARQIYEDARAQGYRASLLVQRRPNVFEQKVANIEPGKRIDVNIRYFHTLAYEDGWYSFVFPTVVGPRYNPVGSADPIESVARDVVAQPAAGTAVRYLRPSERSAHDIGIAVDLDAGVAIEEIESTHAIATRRDGDARAHVELANATTIPNRDFVLRFRVAGDTIKSNLMTYTDPKTEQGYFTLMIYPPAAPVTLERRPIEMVFVLDTSGSMNGRPIEQARAAVASALDRLQEDDTFQVMNFFTDVRRFAPAPVRATRDNVQAAHRYLDSLGAGGGTEMIGGMRAALGFARDPERARYVTFLTDGYIGNEIAILREVNRTIGDARIFSFGVGNSVNRYLLDGLATEGRGAATYLALEDSADEVMAFYFDRISRPALTNVAIDWGNLAARDVYPARLPDLFVGRPVVVTGKFSGSATGVAVRGRSARENVRLEIAAAGDERSQPALRSLWARLKIEDLARRQTAGYEPAATLVGSIRATALEYGLMSAYTSFVAVDASERTAGERGTTVNQAVPVPDGVRYSTSVAER